MAVRWCATPRLVPSLSVLRSAFPSPWGLARKRALEPGPPDQAKKSKHTHTRTGPRQEGPLTQRGSVGVHTKQPPCQPRGVPLVASQ